MQQSGARMQRIDVHSQGVEEKSLIGQEQSEVDVCAGLNQVVDFAKLLVQGGQRSCASMSPNTVGDAPAARFEGAVEAVEIFLTGLAWDMVLCATNGV